MATYPVVNKETGEQKEVVMSVNDWDQWREDNPDWTRDYSDPSTMPGVGEGGEWKDSKLNYKDKKIEVVFVEKFLPRRGRINCSMQDNDGWRWFGTQFTLN